MNSTEDNQNPTQLIDRISNMRRSIDDLKSRIQLEKKYIEQEKRNIQESQSQANWSSPNKSPMQSYPYRPWTSHSIGTFHQYENSTDHSDENLLNFSLPKQSLKDIEEKCETELVKLNRYIDSIKELKRFWRDAMDANNSEGFRKTAENMSSKEKVVGGEPNCLMKSWK